MDLEKSFGPIYTRGLLRRGLSGFAVLGMNREELQASIDAALTFGILWLEVCRQAHAGKLVVEGLKLFVPSGCSTLVRQRMARLHPGAAKWHLYEFEERGEEVVAWRHTRGEFQRFGYFVGRELSPQPPFLMMVAPALHVHVGEVLGAD